MTRLEAIAPELRPQLCRVDNPRAVAILHDDFLAVSYQLADGTPLTRRDLATLDADPATIFEVAVRNLRTASPSRWLPATSVDGLYQYDAPDSLGAARLLLLGSLFDPWPLAGVAVAVPTTRRLLAVPLDTSAALGALGPLMELARLAYDVAPDQLSPDVWWFDGATFRPMRRVDGEMRLPIEMADALRRLVGMQVTGGAWA